MDIRNLYQKYLECRKVSTDTRKIEAGAIFFALKGENFDGNAFAAQAIERGAAFAVIDASSAARDDRYLLVDDTLLALQQLAQHHRKQLKIPVIGLTGSNGKTTTKELIREVLSTKYKTFATQGNLNNHIGVPLSVLSITDGFEIAVIEMGANHLGEIASLCEITQPTHGLITNIGKAHIGTFGGFDNIIRAKSELYQYIIVNKAQAFINSQDDILNNMSKRFEQPVLYPSKGDFYHCEFMAADPFVRIRTEDSDEIQTRLIGAYNFSNIAAALCIAKFFGVATTEANRAVSEYLPENNRSQLITKGSNIIILDAYNANPSSMQAAIENVDGMPAKRRLLILGDMFELEEESEKEHRLIGELLLKKNFDEVLLCGNHMKHAKEVYKRALHFENKQELTNYLKLHKPEEALVLLKASRGIGLETVLNYL